MIAWVGFHANPGRTIIIGTKRVLVDMIRHVGDEGLVIFWYAEFIVRWIVC
jgi:hypothetical protein